MFLALLLSYTFGFDYEVIKSKDRQDDVTLVYLNNQEIFTLIGTDPDSLKKAYSFIARVIQFNQLRYDSQDIVVSRNNLLYSLKWNEQELLVFNEKERTLNENRGNNISKIKRFIDSIKLADNRARIVPDKTVCYRGINKIREISFSQKEAFKFFPAVHAFLPLGTKIRINNPVKDWSIVVQVVKNENLGVDNIIGISSKAIGALGLDVQANGQVRSQLL